MGINFLIMSQHINLSVAQQITFYSIFLPLEVQKAKYFVSELDGIGIRISWQ